VGDAVKDIPTALNNLKNDIGDAVKGTVFKKLEEIAKEFGMALLGIILLAVLFCVLTTVITNYAIEHGMKSTLKWMWMAIKNTLKACISLVRWCLARRTKKREGGEHGTRESDQEIPQRGDIEMTQSRPEQHPYPTQQFYKEPGFDEEEHGHDHRRSFGKDENVYAPEQFNQPRRQSQDTILEHGQFNITEGSHNPYPGHLEK
jgi:hypothetical protein